MKRPLAQQKKILILTIAAILLLSFNLFAQTVQITGTVRNEKSEILSGVSVVEKNTSNGTTTDKNGIYAIAVKSKSSSIIFSAVGYEKKELLLSGKNNFDVELSAIVKSLDDVVVIGYGTIKKSDLTGAVSSIKGSDLQKAQITTVDQALQGRAAGVQVTNSDATPGARANIRIRGTSSLGTSSEPLFVIDGFRGGDIASINPSDIQSIEILKDASATAIYGASGGNGVILITTKRGSAGKFTINLDAYYGVASIRNTLDLMNAKEYAEYRNDVVKNTLPAGTKPFASPDILNQLSNNSTDWQDAIFQKAPLINAQLSMSGGDEKSKYYLSGGWFSQEGIVRNTGYERGNLRFNFDRQLSKKFKFGLNTTLTHSSSNRTNVNTLGGTAGGMVLNTIRMNPAMQVYDSAGNFTYKNDVVKDANSSAATTDVDQIGNPVAYADQAVNKNYVNSIQVNTFGEYEIIPGLSLRILLGGEYQNGWGNAFLPNNLFEQATDKGYAAKYSSASYLFSNENNLTYTKIFNENNSLTVLAGASFLKYKNESGSSSGFGFFTNAYSYNNLGAATTSLNSSSSSEYQLASFYGRVQAKLMEKLLLTATLRADGSSKFGSNHKYGYFPSGAIAYKLGDEAFIKNLKFISDLKIRVGYGITGNDGIAPYLSQYGYSLATVPNSPGVSPGRVTLGGANQVGLAASRPANPDLRWEQTSAFNIGLDLGLFPARLALTVDYYKKTTKDLLWDVALPSTTGFLTTYQNLGEIENSGVEIGLSATPVSSTNVTWNTAFNIAFNNSNIISIGDEPSRLYGSQIGLQPFIARDNFVLIKPGEAIGTFYGYLSDGIWQSQSEIDKSAFNTAYKSTLKPGMEKYKNINGDSTINGSDRTTIGAAYPKIIFGFNNTVSYKGFELNIFLQGQTGSHVLNLNRWYTEVNIASNKSTDILNRWKGEGTSNTLPGAGFEGSRLLADDFVENADYLRIKSLSLSYNFSGIKGFMDRSTLKNLQLYVTGTNLFTWTNYKGFDPEVGSYNGNLFAQGIDHGAYSVARSFIVGIKMGL